MRSTTENERIHQLACALLERRGIEPTQATFAEYSDAAVAASAAVEKKGTTATVPDMLAVGVLPAEADTPNEATIKALGKLAAKGKLVSDGSLTADELVEAVAAEQAKGSITAEQETRTIVAETINGEVYCRGCGFHIADHGCVCQ